VVGICSLYAVIDCTRFMVNRKIFLVGFGLYGSIETAAEYSVNIQVNWTFAGCYYVTLASTLPQSAGLSTSQMEK